MLSIPVVGAVAIATAAGAAWGVTGNKPLGQNLAGRQSDGSVLTAQNQFVRPAGDTIEQTGQPMDLEVNPDGKTAVSLTKSGDGLFTVVDLASHQVLQQYSPPKGTGSGDIGVGGLLYSPDGKTLWATQSKNLLKFTVAGDGTLSAPVVIPIPTDGPGVTPTSADRTPASPLPSDLAWNADRSAILVVLDGYNRLATLDPTSNTVTATSATGVGPRDVTVIGTHAFVSNEAGRQPTAEDFTNLSYDSGTVAEQRDGRASDGTISEIDLATGKVVHTYQVGLDPTSMVAQGADLLVTNSSDDTVSVIDTARQEVTQTINVNPLPGQPYGASPNALAFIDKHAPGGQSRPGQRDRRLRLPGIAHGGSVLGPDPDRVVPRQGHLERAVEEAGRGQPQGSWRPRQGAHPQRGSWHVPGHRPPGVRRQGRGAAAGQPHPGPDVALHLDGVRRQPVERPEPAQRARREEGHAEGTAAQGR